MYQQLDLEKINGSFVRGFRFTQKGLIYWDDFCMTQFYFLILYFE